MRYKIIFSGISCMAYISIIFQKLLCKSKTKRLRTTSKGAVEDETGEQGLTHNDRCTNNTKSELYISHASDDKINESSASDSNTPINRGTGSTTATNHYVATNSTNNIIHNGTEKKKSDSNNNLADKLGDGVDNKIPHTMESLNYA